MHTDVAVVGAGIVGLAHAWAAARRGKSVVVFERSSRAQGASVRNFGMIWPVGQPPGELLALALESRALWLQLGDLSDLWIRPCGSVHLAHENDELAVLEEFAQRSGEWGYECEMLSPHCTLERFPSVQPEGLRGALFSRTECVVDPRQALVRLPAFLAQNHGIEFHYNTTVTRLEPGMVYAADGRVWSAGQIVVCSGSDFETLFPAVFADTGIRRCKLQMLRTPPQPGGWQLGTHVAGGLTLCHYAAFAQCPSLPRLRRRIEHQMPSYVKYGIHVMAAQNELGEVTIGDSHEYDEAIEVFDKDEIDTLILAYLRRLVRLPDDATASRWHGIYAKHPTLPIFTAEPVPGATIRVAPGGAGMTLSFALGEQFFRGSSSA